MYKSDEQYGKRRATLALEAERAGRRTISFETNAIDLAPGKLFSIEGHPRKDLAPDKRLLMTRMALSGNQDGKYEFSGEAVFADDAYRPPLVTPSPRIHGVQSALVVGPAGRGDPHRRVRPRARAVPLGSRARVQRRQLVLDPRQPGLGRAPASA